MPREAIRDNLPKAFIKTGNNKCRVILDCAEVFIERPKSLDRQPATWSDYKQHNTIKLPFLSSCHGGRACRRFITKDSSFYNLLEHDDIIMAGRSFQIQEDLLLHFCNSQIPPRAQTKIQKTKQIRNLRIHVERAINRIKNYRIRKRALAITMMQHFAEIVLVCAALCCIKNVLIETKKINSMWYFL